MSNTKTRFNSSNYHIIKRKFLIPKNSELASQFLKSMEKYIKELIKSVSFTSTQFDYFSGKINNV